MDASIAARSLSSGCAKPARLIDIPDLVAAYYSRVPDPSVLEQSVRFGTSGHRGCAFETTFNEWHVLAISQALCDYRKWKNISGPLYLGRDTHALSIPACASTLEVLAANEVQVSLAEKDEYTPTPAISHAILGYNRGRVAGFADGIVMTPSHNPPDHGGFKYNTPHGGPADIGVTDWIGSRANEYLRNALQGVSRISHAKALHCGTTQRHDFLNHYVNDLANVIDMNAIRSASIRMGVDPLGGAGIHYWAAIADRYDIDLTVVNELVDPRFPFIPVDQDGKRRSDPSSPCTMRRLIDMRDRFDIAFGCDADHDRHGIVTRAGGLLAPNHYLSVAIDYLCRHRPLWGAQASIGKTVVSTGMMDRVAQDLGRKLYEVPVGFKWFVEGLYGSMLGFAGEESAGATFLRSDGSVWTTDKDGIVSALLSAEITARMGRDPGELYAGLVVTHGPCISGQFQARATTAQRNKLSQLSPQQVHRQTLAGESIVGVMAHAPGNGAPIGGLKIASQKGWFVARPSGTEQIYKIYAESFRDEGHLRAVMDDARDIVETMLAI